MFQLKIPKVSYLLPILLDKFVFKIAVCMQLCMVCLDLMSAEWVTNIIQDKKEIKKK